MPVMKEIWDEGECLPDHDFWKRTAYWTIEEGVALILDKEPRKFNSKSIHNAPCDNPTVSTFFEWVELANRAVAVSKLSEKPTPSEFLEWKAITTFGEEGDVGSIYFLEQDRGNPFSFVDYKESYLNLEKLYRAKRERLEELEGIEWEYNDLWDQIEAGELKKNSKNKRKDLDGRKKKSLQKIILAIAINKYRFDPRKMKSSAPKNIESATAECGLLVTDETIRSHLREAVECFPEISDYFEND